MSENMRRTHLASPLVPDLYMYRVSYFLMCCVCVCSTECDNNHHLLSKARLSSQLKHLLLCLGGPWPSFPKAAFPRLSHYTLGRALTPMSRLGLLASERLRVLYEWMVNIMCTEESEHIHFTGKDFLHNISSSLAGLRWYEKWIISSR